MWRREKRLHPPSGGFLGSNGRGQIGGDKLPFYSFTPPAEVNGSSRFPRLIAALRTPPELASGGDARCGVFLAIETDDVRLTASLLARKLRLIRVVAQYSETLPVERPIERVDLVGLEVCNLMAGQSDLAEPLHQKYVRLGVLPSSEENSMAVGREGGPPDDEQARQVRDLAGMPSNKVEVAQGKVRRGAIDEVNAAPRGHPPLARHFRDGAFVATIDGRRPDLYMAALAFAKKHARPVHRFLRPVSALSCQTNRGSAFHRRLPNGFRSFRVEINPVAIPRPERIRSVGRSRGKSPRRPSVPVHDVEFGIAGSAQIEDDPATIWRPACPPNPRPSEESQLDGIRSIAVAHPDLRASRAPG